MIKWLTADSEAAREDGVRFLCRNGERLGVPYKWNTVMSSLATSLEENGLMIGLNSMGHIAGALAYTFGTGEDEYRDRMQIEVHHLFIEQNGSGRMLFDAMRTLASQMLDLPNEIREIAFYAAPTVHNRRLFSKFAILKNTSEHPCGLLDFHSISPGNLYDYTVGRSGDKPK